MEKERNKTKPNSSTLLGILSPAITLTLAATATLLKKDWTWIVLTVVAIGLVLIVMAILSSQISKSNKDMLDELISNDGSLSTYLDHKITILAESIAASGKSISDVQKECKKNIECFFLNQYSQIKYINIEELLALESELSQGEIWIISDELCTDIENRKITDTVGQNLKDGVIYKYFYTQKDKGVDAENRLKATFSKEFSITDISKRMFFSKINSRYDALVKIAKDIVILNPNTAQRRAFVCIFSNETFEIAFYRELKRNEISDLCGMINKKSLFA